MRDTLENYGWIIISLIVISILIALATPLTTYVADSITKNADDITDNFPDDSDYNIPYLVTVRCNISEGGIVRFTGDYDGTRIYLKGENVISFKAIANEGYDFEGWYANGIFISDQMEFEYTVTEQITITARFSTTAQ